MKIHPHINIRLAMESDAEKIWEIYKPYVLHTSASFETEVPALSAFQSRMENILQYLPWLVCVVDNRIAGYAYAMDHRSRQAYLWTKELSVYVHDHFKRKRIATALYTTLIELLKIQGITNCLAGISLPNEASIRLHEKFGFKKVGIFHQIGYKLGAFQDVGWWELFIGDIKISPSGIIPVKSIESTIEFESAVRMGLKYLN